MEISAATREPVISKLVTLPAAASPRPPLALRGPDEDSFAYRYLVAAIHHALIDMDILPNYQFDRRNLRNESHFS